MLKAASGGDSATRNEEKGDGEDDSDDDETEQDSEITLPQQISSLRSVK